MRSHNRPGYLLLLVMLVFLFLPNPSCLARDNAVADPESQSKFVENAILWSLVPGGGHYYLGEGKRATGYIATMLPLIGAGFWLHDQNHRLGREDEANLFWLLALKEWELSIFTTYRSAYGQGNADLKQLGIDDAPVAELLQAPFAAENIRDPWVVAAGLIGVVAAAVDGRNATSHYRDIDRVGLLGADANRDWGSLLYGVDAFGLSLGAAVGEEALWRGVLQNEFEFLYGRKGGLWAASFCFGIAHVVDLDGELSGERVAVASLAGLYLGHLYQRDNHRLSRPIAAHFWYNFMVMLTGFAVDPENNPLGVTVSFSY